MKRTRFAIPVLFVGVWLLFSWLLPERAFAEPIPAVRTVPAGLPPEVRTRLSRERESLDQELQAFLSDAERFNAKPAESQTDAEFAALGERRAQYISRANAFNREVAQASALREIQTAAAAALQKIGTADPARRLLVDKITKFVSEDLQRYQDQLEALMAEVDHLKAPGVKVTRQIHEGIILGLMDPQEKVAEKYKDLRSLFTHEPYITSDANFVFATTNTNDPASEAVRGLLDNHYLGAYTLNTKYGKELVARLQGTHFDRLLAHSNGATIAEALIRRGVIKVDELNVIGGDRSMVNKLGLQELIASGTVKRVVVWINPGDVVPAGSSAALLSPFGPTGSLPVATTALYFSEYLTGANKGGDVRVEYRFLSGSKYNKGQQMRLDNFDAHNLKDAYWPNMTTFLNGKADGIQ
jgi:hypothetical protein